MSVFRDVHQNVPETSYRFDFELASATETIDERENQYATNSFYTDSSLHGRISWFFF